MTRREGAGSHSHHHRPSRKHRMSVSSPSVKRTSVSSSAGTDERRIVAANLRASRLTILYGPSGVGKTSLLRAGVVHDLRQEVTDNVTTRAERAPFRRLRVPRLARRSAARSDERDARRRLRGIGARQRGALAAGPVRCRNLARVDAERTNPARCPRPVRGLLPLSTGRRTEATFVDALPAIVNEPNLGVNVLLSIREDAWAKLDLFEGRIPRLFGNYIRVEHLNRAGAREAIEQPIEEWNKRLAAGESPFTLEPALVDAVIDAAGSGGLALTHDSPRAEPTISKGEKSRRRISSSS